jgi:hypothetical protein
MVLPLEISKELLKDQGLIWKEESQKIFDELFKKASKRYQKDEQILFYMSTKKMN